MEILLRRIALKEEYTIGKLYVNGVYECDTLEDKVRDLTKEKKVYGKTAIPSGRYNITLGVQSPRFSTKMAYQFCAGYLPRLLNVPNFDGVLIHIGNKPQDTEGCVLVGQNKIKGQVINSTNTFRKLYAKLKAAWVAGEEIFITIE